MTKCKGIFYFSIVYLARFWTTTLLNLPYLQKRKHGKIWFYKIAVHFYNINILRHSLYSVTCTHLKNTVQCVWKYRSAHVTTPSSRRKTSPSPEVSSNPFAANADVLSLMIAWFTFSRFSNKWNHIVYNFLSPVFITQHRFLCFIHDVTCISSSFVLLLNSIVSIFVFSFTCWTYFWF